MKQNYATAWLTNNFSYTFIKNRYISVRLLKKKKFTPECCCMCLWMQITYQQVASLVSDFPPQVENQPFHFSSFFPFLISTEISRSLKLPAHQSMSFRWLYVAPFPPLSRKVLCIYEVLTHAACVFFPFNSLYLWTRKHFVEVISIFWIS